MDALERRYWHDFNDFQRELALFADDRDALLGRIGVAGEQREALRRTNVFNDAFHVWHDGPFGTISGLRLGRTAGARAAAAAARRVYTRCTRAAHAPMIRVRLASCARDCEAAVSAAAAVRGARSGAGGVGRDQRGVGAGRAAARHHGPRLPPQLLGHVPRRGPCPSPQGVGGRCTHMISSRHGSRAP